MLAVYILIVREATLDYIDTWNFYTICKQAT